MNSRRAQQFICFLSLIFMAFFFTNAGEAQKPDAAYKPVIPKTWDEQALADLEVPLPNPEFSPKAFPADYYYRIPVRPIYKSYPVYAPGKEPPGYIDWLKQQEPEIIWDDKDKRPRLETESDWINAGEIVFDAPIFYDGIATVDDVRNPEWHKKVQPLTTNEGVLPFATYVIREKGKVELGNNSCGFCHTRVMPSGMVIKGAQGNFAFDRAIAFRNRRNVSLSLQELRRGYRVLAGAPWLKVDDPAARADSMSKEELIAMFEAIPPGVAIRHRSSATAPPAIPDLIGVKDILYLDRTGLVRQRDIGDLMRYAALNNEADFLSSFGGFIPAGEDFQRLPDPGTESRYSEEQLYALALYIYSLKPPPNPNKRTALAVRGEKVFRSEGCAACHTPPLYTSNKLIPAEGFKIPDGHRTRFDILPLSVGTDPTLTLKTRRGTGYYKVPSLRGVWYRGPFEHNGSVLTLEDWFDPRRLRDDYVPTGFKGYGVKTRAVKGHEFGLNLPTGDKKALIAFLKTL
ncbi:MAG TPA: hypothetical protein VLD57_02360 [Blastocatellia bacterium]|nr:hypothetical protein [Blastocatellia bacterium]